MVQQSDDVLGRAQRRGKHGRQQDDGVLVIRTIAMPADTNPAGDIFGGWLMSRMDLAAGNMAGRVSKGRGATVAVEAMQFLRPVKVGDEVTLYATLKTWAERQCASTSMSGHGRVLMTIQKRSQMPILSSWHSMRRANRDKSKMTKLFPASHRSFDDRFFKHVVTNWK